MRLATTLALGLIGVVAWRAWQQRHTRMPGAPAGDMLDDRGTMPPHGDPRVPAVDTDLGPAPPATQSSRGFGDA